MPHYSKPCSCCGLPQIATCSEALGTCPVGVYGSLPETVHATVTDPNPSNYYSGTYALTYSGASPWSLQPGTADGVWWYGVYPSPHPVCGPVGCRICITLKCVGGGLCGNWQMFMEFCYDGLFNESEFTSVEPCGCFTTAVSGQQEIPPNMSFNLSLLTTTDCSTCSPGTSGMLITVGP